MRLVHSQRSRSPKSLPETSQKHSETIPRASRELPRASLRCSGSPPRAPKCSPRAPRDSQYTLPSAQRVSKGPPRGHLSSILAQFNLNMGVSDPILIQIGPQIRTPDVWELILMISKPQRSLLSSLCPLPFSLFSLLSSHSTSLLSFLSSYFSFHQSTEIQDGSTDSLNIQEGSAGLAKRLQFSIR